MFAFFAKDVLHTAICLFVIAYLLQKMLKGKELI